MVLAANNVLPSNVDRTEYAAIKKLGCREKSRAETFIDYNGDRGERTLAKKPFSSFHVSFAKGRPNRVSETDASVSGGEEHLTKSQKVHQSFFRIPMVPLHSSKLKRHLLLISPIFSQTSLTLSRRIGKPAASFDFQTAEVIDDAIVSHGRATIPAFLLVSASAIQ